MELQALSTMSIMQDKDKLQTKISFVIPAHNEANYLAACLSSVIQELNRSKVRAEIIVVNNASTDTTKQVALSFPGVCVVDEARKGVCYARQAGYLVAAGDLVANIDADSILPTGWVEKVMSAFALQPNLAGLSGPQIFYDLSFLKNVGIYLYHGVSYFGYFLNRFIFRQGSLLQGGNAIIRKSALDKIGGYNEEFKFYGDDTDLAKRLNKIGPVVFTLRLPIYASGRRLEKEGIIKMGVRYSLNYIWATLLSRPFTHEYVDVRQPVPPKVKLPWK